LSNRLRAYWRLMRLDRPIGILLLLWPSLWALLLFSPTRPSWFIISVFVSGVVVMRSAGCVLNDIADRYIDANVKRSCQRPLATQELSVNEALFIVFLLCSCALALVLLLNRLCLYLSIIGFVLAVIYPYMKRYMSLPQSVLGLAFSWGIPMAAAAVLGTVPPLAWLLYLATIFWVIAYDTQYAMVDRDDDLLIGVKSSAILFGQCDCMMIGLLQSLFCLLLVAIGVVHRLAWPYYLSLAGVVFLFVYQQYLIKDRSRERCFQAFLHNQWVGFSLFLGVLLSTTLK
jgi:4-hydroxybenzoate polyprenyltransferase